MDLVTNLRRHALNHGEKLALVDGDRRWSFGELWEDSARFASALSKMPFVRGDRVAVVTRNRAEHVIALYGIAIAGGVAVPLPSRMPGEQLARVLANANCVAIVWDGTMAEAPAEVVDELPADRWIVLDGVAAGGRTFSEMVAGAGAGEGAAEVGFDDELVILYSSGTTGNPKGMVLTHGCRVAYALAFSTEFGLSRDDVFGLLTPIYHNGAQMWLHSVLYCGGTVVLAHDVEELLGDHGITMTFLIPPQLRDLGRAAAGVPRGPLTVVTGTMPVGARVKHDALERMPWCVLFEAYGLTEIGVLTVLRPEEQRDHGESIGRAFLDCEIRLCDPVSGEPALEQGEIVASGPCLMRRYHARKDLNASCFVDGFFKTGDIARRDADGFLYLLDRKDDLIVSGGVNVFARDVEAVLGDYAGVDAVCVVGVADDRWGEAVTAAVVAGPELDQEALLAYCRSRMSPPQVPKRVVLLDALPRNALGKILRRDVRALASDTTRSAS